MFTNIVSGYIRTIMKYTLYFVSLCVFLCMSLASNVYLLRFFLTSMTSLLTPLQGGNVRGDSPRAYP